MAAKKTVCFMATLAILAGIVSAEENSDKGFFIFAGFLYNYEKTGPDPKIEHSGLNISAGLGYDFERIAVNFLFDNNLIDRITYIGYGYGNLKIKDGRNAGFGVNIGYKLLNGPVFDLTIPVGVLFRLSGVNVEHGDEKKFSYQYLNVESGLMPSIKLSRTFMLLLPFNIGLPVGLPVYKNYNFVNYTERDFDIFNFSVGINLRRTF
jgi:hypothetical protein